MNKIDAETFEIVVWSIFIKSHGLNARMRCYGGIALFFAILGRFSTITVFNFSKIHSMYYVSEIHNYYLKKGKTIIGKYYVSEIHNIFQ